MLAIAALEVIGHTSGDLAKSVVGVLGAASIVATEELGRNFVTALDNNCRTQADGPSLCLTEVEIKVNTELCCHTVQVIAALGVTSFIALVVIESTQISKTATSLNLEDTTCALVTTEPVHEVDLGVTKDGHVVDNIFTVTHVPVSVVVETCLKLEFQAQNGSDALSQVDACYCAIGSIPIVKVCAYATFSTD